MSERITLDDLLDGFIPSHGQDAGENGLIMIIRGRRVDLASAKFDDDVTKQYAEAMISLRRGLFGGKKFDATAYFAKKKRSKK